MANQAARGVVGSRNRARAFALPVLMLLLGVTSACSLRRHRSKGAPQVAASTKRGGAASQVAVIDPEILRVGKLCARNSLEACNDLHDYALLSDTPKAKVTEALQALGEACGAESAHGCWAFGNLLAQQAGAVDRQELAVVGGIACEALGGGEGCGLVTATNELLVAGSPKMKLAKRAFERACKLGSVNGCADLGTCYQNGFGAVRDPGKAATFYADACRGDNQLACTNLAGLYDQGSGVPHDSDKATALFRRACDRDEAAACAGLAKQYDEAGETPRAAALFAKACGMDDAASCAVLASAGYRVYHELREDAERRRAERLAAR